MKTNFVEIPNRKGIIFYPENGVKARHEKLNAGYYKVYDQGGLMQKLVTFDAIVFKENLITFKNGIVEDIVKKVDNFFSPKTQDAYKQLSIAHKMGCIMYGPPGTGKTCTAQVVMSILIEKYGAICIDATGSKLDFILNCVQIIRDVQDSPIVIFVDEVESSFQYEENNYLTFLDGANSVTNAIFLGCTNYLDRIPKRIRERRSRIKHLFEVKSLPFTVYQEYLRDKLGMLGEAVVQEFAFKAEEAGLTIDELKHAIIDYHIDKIPINKAISSVKEYARQDVWDEVNPDGKTH